MTELVNKIQKCFFFKDLVDTHVHGCVRCQTTAVNKKYQFCFLVCLSFQCILHKQDAVVLISDEIVLVPSNSFYNKAWQMGLQEAPVARDETVKNEQTLVYA